MKNLQYTFLTLLFTFFVTPQLFAQVAYDSVSLQAGYTNMSFYSLPNGEQANVSNTDWDVAFATSGFGYTARVNTAKGNELYTYPGGDNTSWATLDTTGMTGWRQHYDSDTSWEFGAFSDHLNPSNGNDVGWGIYNGATHDIFGDSLFVLKLTNGDYKKMEIKKLMGGKFYIRYANLNGSNLIDTTVNKMTYTGKNWVYYDITTSQEIDKEPLAADWDILFTQYSTEVAPNLFYPVVGALQNINVTIAKAYPIANAQTVTDYAPYTFDTKINAIGYNWKSFDMQSNTFTIADSTAFFVQARNGSIWRMVMTGYGGTATGNIIFEKEQLSWPTAVNNYTEKMNVAVYPNPVTNADVHLVFEAGNDANWQATIYSMTGQLLQHEIINAQGFIDYRLGISELASGTYIVQLANAKGVQHAQQIVVK